MDCDFHMLCFFVVFRETRIKLQETNVTTIQLVVLSFNIITPNKIVTSLFRSGYSTSTVIVSVKMRHPNACVGELGMNTRND